MTTLVTGATGFIGRHLLAQLTGARGTNHPVLALMRRPERLPDLRERVTALDGDGSRIEALPGDLDMPGLGLAQQPAGVKTVVHLGATFAWGLAPQAARRTNVEGALAVADLARRKHARLVMISGFMLENDAHLRALGIRAEAPHATDWARVYARVGAYEASKLEGALRVRAYAREHGMQMVEVQPATVSGHSETGELDAAQPLYSLIENLARGRMAMVPGTPSHWLPLVSVDALAALIAAAIEAEAVPQKLLALDAETPNLAGLLGVLATALGRKAPTRHMPMPLLAGLLKVPGLAKLMNTAPESLHFLQPTRFDTSATSRFGAAQGLQPAPIEKSIRASAAYWRAQAGA